MAFTPSKYQQDIFDWVENGRGDGFVDAVAGSGKTTTLVEIAKRLQGDDAIFFAFNKTVVDTLNERLPAKFKAQTLNSFGYQILRENVSAKWKMEGNKYGNLLFNSLKDMGIPPESFARALNVLKDLVSYTQSNLGDGSDESLDELVEYYGIELPTGFDTKDVYNLVRSTLHTGEAMARQGQISFDDMIWLPAKWQLDAPKSGFIMVDEAQDLSKSKLELVLSGRAKGGRILFVGDPRQSIYGFAGADANAVPNILERTGAKVMPLSVSYRCGSNIVAHAQKLVPHIEAAPNAIEGQVLTGVKIDYLIDNVKNGDLILSRVTAPLLGLCIKLIKNRIPARVKGRDIGKQLVQAAKEALKGRPWTELESALDEYLETHTIALMQRKNNATALQSLQDKVEGIRECALGFNVNSLDEFATAVDSIFADGKALVNLSTIHRAKGQEASCVYIIMPEKLPLVWKGQREWEYLQEVNLDYVARTRAMKTLVYIKTEKS